MSEVTRVPRRDSRDDKDVNPRGCNGAVGCLQQYGRDAECDKQVALFVHPQLVVSPGCLLRTLRGCASSLSAG